MSDPEPQGTDFTELPCPCRHAILSAMDSHMRGAWRQVSKLACQDVYDATCGLQWSRQRHLALRRHARMHGAPPVPAPTALPTALFAKLPGLKRLECWYVESLCSLDGLPPSLEAFVLSERHGNNAQCATDFAPLSLCTALRELSLHDTSAFCDFTVLLPCVHLVQLELTALSNKPGVGQRLAATIRQLTALQHLNITATDLSAADITALAAALAALPHLRRLDLTEILRRHTPDSVAALGSMLRALTSLQQLAMENCDLGPDGVEQLAPVLAGLTSLQGLNLSGNAADPAGAAPLGRAIRGLNLSRLELANCDLAAGVMELAPIIGGMGGLQALLIGGNMMGPDGAAALAPALRRLMRLTSLSLSGGELGGVGSEALAPALRRLTALTELDLEDSGCGPSGATALAPALQALRGLRALLLGGNGFGAAGVAALAPALTALTALTRLGLAYNALGPPGAEELASALGHLSSLQDLALTNNRMGSEGASALSAALGALTALTRLGLGMNGVGDEGGVALAPAIGRLVGLRVLKLDGNRLGRKGVAALAPAIKGIAHPERLTLGSPELWESEGVFDVDW